MRAAAVRVTEPQPRRPDRRPLSGDDGWSRRPHSIKYLAGVLNFGAYVLMEEIVAYTHEGHDPPQWAGVNGWYRDGDAEPVDWITYWQSIMGYDERSAWKALKELRDHHLIEERGHGRGMQFRPLVERFRRCRPRTPRGGWTQKPAGHAEEYDSAAVLQDAEREDLVVEMPKRPRELPAVIQCPAGLDCPVDRLVQINGQLRNPTSEAKAKHELISAESTAQTELLNSSSANKKQTSWDSVKGRLREQLPSISYANWVERTAQVAVTDGCVVVSVPDEATQRWLEEEYSQQIGAELREVGATSVRYVVRTPAEDCRPLESPTETLRQALLSQFGPHVPVALSVEDAERIHAALETPLTYLLAVMAAKRKRLRSWRFVSDHLCHDARRKWLQHCGIPLE